MIYSLLIEAWEQTSTSDKRWLISKFGSFGEWANSMQSKFYNAGDGNV